VDDYWRRRRATEQTLTFRDVATAHGSPGQVLKLPEWDVRQRLELLEADLDGPFSYRETTSLQRLSRRENGKRDFLAAIYP